MTQQARQVLVECKYVRAQLADGVQGTEWGATWKGLVTLLRSVGHVLDKTDGATSPAMRQAVDEAWSAPKPPIFRDFIDTERNMAIKEGKPAGGQSVEVKPAAFGVVMFGEAAFAGGTARIYYEMTDGPYKGRDPRDLADEAIAWWESYLDGIDKRAEELATSS